MLMLSKRDDHAIGKANKPSDFSPHTQVLVMLFRGLNLVEFSPQRNTYYPARKPIFFLPRECKDRANTQIGTTVIPQTPLISKVISMLWGTSRKPIPIGHIWVMKQVRNSGSHSKTPQHFAGWATRA